MHHGCTLFVRALGAFATPIAPAASHAHVTLATPQAPAGAYYKVLSVARGSEGSPVTQVIDGIPPGVQGDTPRAKPGWRIDWAELPKPGQSPHDLTSPAALLEVLPAEHAHHAH